MYAMLVFPVPLTMLVRPLPFTLNPPIVVVPSTSTLKLLLMVVYPSSLIRLALICIVSALWLIALMIPFWETFSDICVACWSILLSAVETLPLSVSTVWLFAHSLFPYALMTEPPALLRLPSLLKLASTVLM